MSNVLQSVPVTTDGTGAAVRDVRLGPCLLLGVAVELDELETPDITLTDEPGGVTLLDVNAVAADGRYQLVVPYQGSDGVDIAVDVDNGGGSSSVGAFGPVLVYGRIHVAIAGGGANKSGRLVFVVSR